MSIQRYILTIATTGKDDPDGEYAWPEDLRVRELPVMKGKETQ